MGCPFGKSCFISDYIKTGGRENYIAHKKVLVEEFNSLNIAGMPKITDLFPLNGAFVNLEYPLPNGEKVKLLDDRDIYLGNQVECEFNEGDFATCFGLVAGRDFLVVAQYGVNGANPELLVYKQL